LLPHVPLLTDSVCPCWAAPLITGEPLGAGGLGSTGAVPALVAEASPKAFDAVTVTVSDCPTSAAVNVIEFPVCPSDQAYENAIGASPDQSPGVAVRTSPCWVGPEIPGRAPVFDGGVSALAGAAASHQLEAVQSSAKDKKRLVEPLRRVLGRLSHTTHVSHANRPTTPVVWV
jgi:hypothetical protein